MKENDTIAAIASGMNYGGISVIRISGPDALKITSEIFVSPKLSTRSYPQFVDIPTHTIHYGWVYDVDNPVDEVLMLWMKGPKSYTGEDTVEIDCHGGTFVSKKVLETVIKHGARPADPGEFTKRAFLNGRIDLAQAEAVMNVISAQNEYALSSAQKQLKGEVSKKVKELRDAILYETAYIETALDDPEHFDLEGYPEQLEKKLSDLCLNMKHILAASDDRQVLDEGINTVIIGKPNSGKSSLLNYFAGEEKAIVTDIPGTTRDSVESVINLGGLTLKITDTAGIRQSGDLVEKIGIEKARKLAQGADLVLFMMDVSTELDENDSEILEIIKDKNAIIILNKNDLEPKISEESIKERTGLPVVSISVKEKTGLDELKQLIIHMFESGMLQWNNQIILTGMRHKALMNSALESLKLTLESIRNGMPEDFFTIDMIDACRYLGEITGEEISDDLANKIFSEFCVGK